MKRLSLLLLLVLPLVAGCGSKERMPYLGRWAGEWVVEEFVVGANSAARRKKETMAAELQLYATKDRFVLTLTGKQQSVEIEGTWKIREKKRDLWLTPAALRNDDRGGEAFRDPNLPFVPTERLQAAFSRPFRLSPDKGELVGLPFSIANAIGRFRLESQKL